MTAAVVAAGATLAVAAMLVTSRKGKKSGRRSIKDLVRPNIASLQPYRCARDDYSEGTLLDANENSIGATVVELPDKRDLNRYPCPYQRDLKEMIAKYRYSERKSTLKSDSGIFFFADLNMLLGRGAGFVKQSG